MISELLKPLLGPIINKLVDRIPDPNERKRAKEEFEAQILAAMANASEAQTRINEVEDGHLNVFVSGWRPFIGWVCGAGLAWAFIVQPLAVWGVKVWGDPTIELPLINTDGLYQLLMAMLGFGGLRTYEKLKGVASASEKT